MTRDMGPGTCDCKITEEDVGVGRIDQICQLHLGKFTANDSGNIELLVSIQRPGVLQWRDFCGGFGFKVLDIRGSRGGRLKDCWRHISVCGFNGLLKEFKFHFEILSPFWRRLRHTGVI